MRRGLQKQKAQIDPSNSVFYQSQLDVILAKAIYNQI